MSHNPVREVLPPVIDAVPPSVVQKIYDLKYFTCDIVVGNSFTHGH